MPPRGNARSERSLRGGGRARWEQPPAGSASSAVVASLKTNKGEDAEAGKPEMGKAVAIKEKREIRRGRARGVPDREAGRGIQCRARSHKRI